MKSITPKEARDKLDNGDFIVLDVREPYEIEAASVPDYLSIPMRQIPQNLDQIPKDKEVGVLCHHGSRSARVTMYLEQQGFENIVNINGGIDEWAKQTDDDIPMYQKAFGQARVIS